MIAPCLFAISIHALLDHDPSSIISNDEAVKVEFETVLHRGAVNLGDQPARPGQLGTIDPRPLSYS